MLGPFLKDLRLLPQYIDPLRPSFLLALCSIGFNPLFWNIVARSEYRQRRLTRACGGPYRGCYLLAATIFLLGLLRDYIYALALDDQQTMQSSGTMRGVGLTMLVLGNVLVLSSMWVLGITGTYLGDYFGILMKDRVTGFPFNIVDNPMYDGSTLCFLGTALWRASPAGMVLSLYVHIVYTIALCYESPFTAMIYANREHDTGRLKYTENNGSANTAHNQSSHANKSHATVSRRSRREDK